MAAGWSCCGLHTRTPRYTHILLWDRVRFYLYFILANQPKIQQSQDCHIPEKTSVNSLSGLSCLLESSAFSLLYPKDTLAGWWQNICSKKHYESNPNVWKIGRRQVWRAGGVGYRLVASAVSSKEVFVRTYDENDAYVFYRQNIKSDGISHHGKLERPLQLWVFSWVFIGIIFTSVSRVGKRVHL